MNTLVAIDQSQSYQSNRGMARYARTIVRWLEAMEGIDIVRLPSKESRIVSPERMGQLTPFWEQVLLPRYLRKLSPGAVIYPFNTGPLARDGRVTEIVVLHDLIFLDPENGFAGPVTIRHRLGRFYRSKIVPRLLDSDLNILTVSQYTKAAICDRFHIDASRIAVVPCALEDSHFVREDDIDRQCSKYIVHVGGDVPTKNVSATIEMYALLPRRIRQRYQLVIFGVRSSTSIRRFREMSRTHGIENRLLLMPAVTDEELLRYYDQAILTVFPSHMEGFGIPVLESMARGVPVVCSNRGPLPEIAGDAAVYFDPSNVPEFAEAVLSVLDDLDCRHRLALSALVRSKAFSEGSLSKVFERYARRLILRSAEVGGNCLR